MTEKIEALSVALWPIKSISSVHSQVRAKPYLDEKWPRAISLVIVLKRSLKEGNGFGYAMLSGGGSGRSEGCLYLLFIIINTHTSL